MHSISIRGFELIRSNGRYNFYTFHRSMRTTHFTPHFQVQLDLPVVSAFCAKPMGRTHLVWTPVANTTTWKPHGVCDGPTFAALLAAKLADSEGAKPLPIMCNRSESGGFSWEIGQYGDYRPLGTGDRGSKTIDALARERAAKLQRRREWYMPRCSPSRRRPSWSRDGSGMPRCPPSRRRPSWSRGGSVAESTRRPGHWPELRRCLCCRVTSSLVTGCASLDVDGPRNRECSTVPGMPKLLLVAS